jgi:hypothetical protein
MTANNLKRTYSTGLAAAILIGGVGTAQAGSILVGDKTGAIWSVVADTTIGTKAATPFITPNDGFGKTIVMRDIAYANGGDLYGVDVGNLYSIDTTTGVASVVGAGLSGVGVNGSNTGMNALFFDGSTMFGMSNGTESLYTIDTVTGTAAAVGSSLGFKSEGDIEQSTTSGNLYATTTTDASASPSWFNEITKAGGIPVGGVSFNTGVQDVWGLAYSEGTLYGAAGTKLYSINPATAIITELGVITAGNGAAIDVAYGATRPVPLPAAAWLFGSALLGMIGVGRLGRKRAAV